MSLTIKFKSPLYYLVPVGALLLLCTIYAEAAQLYRYKDAAGNVVLGRTIPPQLVGQGYEVLNEKGRVVTRIAPALTPEQIAQRNLELQAEARKEQVRIVREERDAKLKQLYSHPNDAVRILKRRIQDIQDVVSAKQGKIEFSNKEIFELEAKGADLQRKGLPVPERLMSRIAVLKQDVANGHADIEELQADYFSVLREFDEKIKRLEVILDKSATSYSAFLKSLETTAPEATSEPKS